jgi:hypothetical protein
LEAETLGRYENAFSEEMGAQLVSRVKELSCLLPFSRKELLKLHMICPKAYRPTETYERNQVCLETFLLSIHEQAASV